jgi:hypothetical protein
MSEASLRTFARDAIRPLDVVGGCGTVLGMKIQPLTDATTAVSLFVDAAACGLLGAANVLDDAALDMELVKGTTLTVRSLRIGATAAVLASVPLVALDVLTGGVSKRRMEGALSRQSSTSSWSWATGGHIPPFHRDCLSRP